jgi:hypothetical protein
MPPIIARVIQTLMGIFIGWDSDEGVGPGGPTCGYSLDSDQSWDRAAEEYSSRTNAA